MIEGLLLVPWVYAHRRAVEQPEYLDCDDCQATQPLIVRQRWHCGHLPRSSWDGHEPCYPRQHGGSYSGQTCPGALVTHPHVTEALRYFGWHKDGFLEAGLATLGASPTPLLFACFELLSMSCRAVEQWTLEQLRST